MNTTQIIRQPEVCRRLSISRTTLYQLIKDEQFPQPIKICGGRASGWLETDIDEFIQAAVDSARRPTKDSNGMSAPAI